MNINILDYAEGTHILKYSFGQQVSQRSPGYISPIEGGEIEQVLSCGRSFVRDDIATDPSFRWDDQLLDAGLRSSIMLPITSNGAVIGSLTFRSRRAGAFGPAEQGRLERLANQISPAVANSQLYLESLQSEQEQHRLAQESRLMAEISRVISSNSDIYETYELLADGIQALIPFDRMTFSFANQKGGVAVPVWITGTHVPGRGLGEHVPMAGSLAGEVIRKNSPMLVEPVTEADLDRLPGILPNFILGLRSFMGAPLVYRDEPIGVLQVQSWKTGVYSQWHLDILERVGQQIAGAIANARQFADLTQAEEAMRVSEEKYRTLVNDSPDMILVSRIDDFRITEVNDRACEQYGYTREQLLGMNIFDLEIEPPLQQEVRALYDNTPVGQVVEVFGTNKRKNGTTFPVHVRFSKLNGELAIANVRDITELKVAEEMRIQWAEEASVMAEIGRTVSASLDINEVYESLAEEIRKLIPFDRFSMSLVDHEKATASPTWELGAKFPGLEPGDDVPLAGGMAGEVVRTKSPILLEAESAADLEQRFPGLLGIFQAGFRSFLAVPLFSRDAVIGVLRVGSKNGGVYTQRHLKLLEQIGN